MRERRVAVLDFNNNVAAERGASLSTSLADMLTSELVNHPNVVVFDRRTLRARLTPREIAAMPSREAARRAGLDYLILGSVSRLRQNYVVSARIFSVASGEVVPGSSVTRHCKRDEDLYPVISAMARVVGLHLQELDRRHDTRARSLSQGR